MKPLKRPMFRNGGPLKEGIMSGMQDRPGYSLAGRVGGFFLNQIPKVKNFFRSQAGQVAGGTGASKYASQRMAPLSTMEKIKGYFQTAPAGQLIAKDPLVKFTTGTGTVATKAIKPLVKGAFTTPSGLLATAYLSDALPGGQPLFGNTNIFGQKFDPVTGNKISGDKSETPDTEPKFSRKDGKDDSNTTDGTSNVKTEKLDPKVFEDRKKYYYSLMGIDKMNKDAAYDSLIDASKIIQEEGGDLKGSIKSGNLQNRIIQAISGNLDKSADLKRQIDAAVLKGEITKDIEQSKVPESLRVARSLGISDKEYKSKILGKEDVATTLSNYMMKQGALTPDVVAGALKTEGKDPLAVIGSDKIEDFKKKFGADKDEIDLLLTAEDLKPGFYVVGKRIVELDDKGKASFYY